MKKWILTAGLILFLVLFAPRKIMAAKPRLRRGGSTGGSTEGSLSVGTKSSVKFRADRRAVILALSGLASAKSVSYQLTYTADGIPQGVMGSVQPSESSETRELLFGTCSKNVCRYHSNIINARLVVTFKLKSGVTIRKPYRLKV